MRRALVTGATGFIGRHLMAQLRADGWQVMGAVRTDPREAPPGMLGMGQGPWNTAAFAAALSQVRPEVVFHMAGLDLGR